MSVKKIVSRITGGLGNQLFCYAAARRLALINDAELVIDHVSGFARDYKYKRKYQLDHFNIPCRKATPSELLEPFGRYRRGLKRRLSLCRPFDRRGYLSQEIIEFDPRLLNIRIQGTLYLEGYWQSENYFKDIKDTIRDDLLIIPPDDQTNETVAEKISGCNSVGLHVRWFDLPGKAGVNNLVDEYYHQAIATIERQVPSAHYFIFSDNAQAAMERLMLPRDRVTCVLHNQGDENAYADLWLMSLCRHFITANSTFSWWGAWLGRHPDKIVITPGFELREGTAWWGFDGLIPPEWIKC